MNEWLGPKNSADLVQGNFITETQVADNGATEQFTKGVGLTQRYNLSGGGGVPHPLLDGRLDGRS